LAHLPSWDDRGNVAAYDYVAGVKGALRKRIGPRADCFRGGTWPTSREQKSNRQTTKMSSSEYRRQKYRP
jgi:hypothetical protein